MFDSDSGKMSFSKRNEKKRRSALPTSLLGTENLIFEGASVARTCASWDTIKTSVAFKLEIENYTKVYVDAQRSE